MAKTRLIQIFPSAEFAQRETENSVPLLWIIAYLEQILRAIPKECRKSATFTKWKGSEIRYEKELSPVEEVEEGLGEIVENLAQIVAQNKGLSKKELEDLVESLQAL